MYMYVYIYTSPYIYIYLSMYVYYIIVAHFGDAATQIARPGVQRGRGHSTLGSRELSAWAGAWSIYLSIYISIYMYLYIYIYICVCVCVWSYIYIYKYVYLYIYLSISICSYIYIYICTYIYTHIHIYLSIYICIWYYIGTFWRCRSAKSVSGRAVRCKPLSSRLTSTLGLDDLINIYVHTHTYDMYIRAIYIYNIRTFWRCRSANSASGNAER